MGHRRTLVRRVKDLLRLQSGRGGELGAVLISRNDVAVSNPGLAARIEETLARAVAQSPRPFRAVIEAAHGDKTAHIRLEEHLPSGSSRPRETPLDLTLDLAGLRHAIDALMA